MDTAKTNVNQLLKAHMKYMTQRQGVLAQNIANIDTPRYKANELKKVDFNTLLTTSNRRLELAATSPTHLNGTLASSDGDYQTIKDDNAFEITPTGNNVVLEDQMGKVSETTGQFQLSSSMLRKFTAMYRRAAGGQQ